MFSQYFDIFALRADLVRANKTRKWFFGVRIQVTEGVERVIIQAQAKAKANQILSAGLTDKTLKDKGIDATIKLSESPNSKVIVIGSGKDGGLPLILGGGS